jgi:hypothetical protein
VIIMARPFNTPQVWNGTYGDVEIATRNDLGKLGEEVVESAIAKIAFNLARKLDMGAGMATAAVAKELRDTLTAIKESIGKKNAVIEALGRMSPRLPTEVGNSKNN